MDFHGFYTGRAIKAQAFSARLPVMEQQIS